MRRAKSISDLITVQEPNLDALSKRAKRFASMSPEERARAWSQGGFSKAVTDQSGENVYRKVNVEPRHFAAFIARNPHYEPVPYEEVVSGFVLNAEGAQNVAGIAGIGGDCILMRCSKQLYEEKEQLRKKRMLQTKDRHNREYRAAIEQITKDTGGMVTSKGPQEVVETIKPTSDLGFEEE